jgi:peroxiredoxin
MMQFVSARLAPATLALLLLALVGCPAKPTPNGSSPTSSAKIDANELLESMRAVYRQAKSYRDDGRLRWQAKDGNAWRDGQIEFSTAFERPNRLDLRVRGLHLTSNGRRIRATISDTNLGDYTKQMLEVAAPDELQVEKLLADAAVASALTDGAIDSIPWPLRMLTDDASLERLLAGSLKLLPDDALDGKALHRVEVTQADRRTVLWIEPKTFLLRRVELPEPDSATNIRHVLADYAGAQIDGPIDGERFDRSVPAGATRVQYFVARPPAIKLPTELLGEKVGDFALEKTDGSLLKRDALAGQIVVLAWFDQNPASQHTLAQLQKVYEQFRTNDKVRFFAVTPPVPLSNQELQKTLTKAAVAFPLVRDEQAAGREVFKIPGAPTVVVLDGEHRAQEFIDGFQPVLDKLLPDVIGELLKGGNPAGELRQMIAQDAANFRRQLASAKVGARGTVVDITPTEIVPARPAEKLNLTKLWTCDEVKSPGNILVLADSGEAPPTLLVMDHEEDWKTVAELDAEGKLVERHVIDLPQSAAIASLRTAVDAAGRRWYVGSSRLARQAFVLTDEWKVAAAYPEADARHDGVGDFALVDFKGDGQLQMCVGFWGALGTHGVSLSGERQWSNRAAAPVMSLAISPPDAADRRQILAATDRGEIVAINGFGNSDPPQRVEHQAITSLYASQIGASAISIYMGLALQADGSQIATALGEKLEPMWDVPLPAGIHQNQIQPVASGKLLDGKVGQWLFAGADGTIGIVADDASFFDSFAVGQELTGIAVAQFGDKRVLLTATAEGVTAWSVSSKQPASN